MHDAALLFRIVARIAVSRNLVWHCISITACLSNAALMQGKLIKDKTEQMGKSNSKSFNMKPWISAAYYKENFQNCFATYIRSTMPGSRTSCYPRQLCIGGPEGLERSENRSGVKLSGSEAENKSC